MFADENQKFLWGKGQILKILHGVWKLFGKQWGHLKQGGNASLPQGGWTPLLWCPGLGFSYI